MELTGPETLTKPAALRTHSFVLELPQGRWKGAGSRFLGQHPKPVESVIQWLILELPVQSIS